MPRAKSQDPAPYPGAPAPSISDDDIIARALAILESRVRTGPIMSSPTIVKDYCKIHFAEPSAQGREEFTVLYLDSSHKLIKAETLFRGTLTQTAVYPREVVRGALACNAAAVVLAHNHPSGMPEPSRADEYLTQTLKSALSLVDVRVLDHLVVGDTVVSFAERGLI